jgi:GNAT superfamily N-acetyltransferase
VGEGGGYDQVAGDDAEQGTATAHGGGGDGGGGGEDDVEKDLAHLAKGVDATRRGRGRGSSLLQRAAAAVTTAAVTATPRTVWLVDVLLFVVPAWSVMFLVGLYKAPGFNP